MRSFILAVVAAVALASPVAAQTDAAAPAAAAVPAAAGHYTTADTPIGTLLDDPAAHAVLEAHMPTLVASPQIDMARSLTLKALQGYAPDMASDEVLAAIDTDLAALPSH